MRRAMLSGVLLAATALVSQPALALDVTGEDEAAPFGADVYPMPASELEAERGGLMTPFGEINFGAVLRTIIDGKIALETQLVWSPEGPVKTVVSNITNTVQNLQSGGLNFTPDAGATNGALQGAGAKPLQDLPGMDLTKESVDSGLTPAIDKVTQATPTGGEALGLAGQLIPPNNPTLDTIVDAALDLTGDDLPKPPTPPNPPGGSGETIQQAVADPIGDMVVASTTTGQTPQQVIEAAAALGIDLGAIAGGDAMVLQGEDGGTAILHNISETGLSNVLLNTATNQDVRIETDITLVMPGLEAFQQDILSQNLQLDLFDAIGNALTSGLP